MNAIYIGSVLFLIFDIWWLLWYNDDINAERITIIDG